MNVLERKVSRSLRRKEAPVGLADRVLERLDETRMPRKRRSRRVRLLSRVAAVLLVGTIGTGAWIEHQQSVRERREAEQASVLVKLALHIASEKTNIARTHLTGVDTVEKNERKDGTQNEKKND